MTEVEGEFSYIVAVAFTLNYIIGCGFLTLPWGFFQTGNELALSGLAVLSIFSIASAIYVLEAMARGNTVLSLNNNYKRNFELHTVGKHKIDLPDLCEMFIGYYTGKCLYTFCIGLYLYGTLAAYSNVFASALSEQIHVLENHEANYLLFLTVFGLIVTPLSCMELTEQIFVQMVLSLCRIIMLVVMVLTITFSVFSCDEGSNPSSCRVFSDYEYSGQSSPPNNMSHLYLLLPLLAYANIYHHSIPALAHPVADKTQLRSIFTVALVVCACSYGVVSVIVSKYFGGHINASANLNWAVYTAGTNPNEWSFTRVVAALVSYYVVLFPALDVSSAFPLNAITLGNNLRSYFHRPTAGSVLSKSGLSHISEYTDRSTGRFGAASDADRLIPGSIELPTYGERSVEHVSPVSGGEDDGSVIFYRLLAVLPAYLIAAFVRDLNYITSYTGIAGFIIVFVYPALLSIQSKTTLRDKYSIFQTKTLFSVAESDSFIVTQWWRFILSDAMRYTVLIVGVILVGYVFYNLSA